MLKKVEGQHNTCTSSPLGGRGGDMENIPLDILYEEYRKHYGCDPSTNPVTRRIQFENLIRRAKRPGAT